MESPGREAVTIDLSMPGSEKTLKDKPFIIVGGSKFTMVAKFKVQHEILSGLHYVQVVKRRSRVGLEATVSRDSEMIVRPDLLRSYEMRNLHMFNWTASDYSTG